MLCDKCKKNVATYHSKTIINGVETNEHLCSDCAKKAGVDTSFDFGNFGLFDMFGSPFIEDNDFGLGYLPSSIFESGNDFYEDRYSSKGILNDAMQSIKKGAKEFKEEKSKIDPNLKKLQDELKDAVDKEDYEKAAELKKKIESLNNKDQNKDKNNDKKGE